MFTRTGTTWTQQAYVKASNTGKAAQGDDPGDGDQFGFSLALSGDGNTMAVGAITEDGVAQQINGNDKDDTAQSAGAVYVFARTGSTWAQQAYVKATQQEAGDLLGFSVALSADGNTLAAAAFNENGSGRGINPPHDNKSGGSGALFVFTRQNGSWTQQAYIKGSRSEPSDGFGFATSISEDGNTIAVGSGDEACLTPGIDPPGCADDAPPLRGANIWVGAAYVFVRTGTTWREQAFIKAPNARPVQLVRRPAGAERRRQYARRHFVSRGQRRAAASVRRRFSSSSSRRFSMPGGSTRTRRRNRARCMSSPAPA